MTLEGEVEVSAPQANALEVLLLQGADCFYASDPELERDLHASIGSLLRELVAIRRTGGKVHLNLFNTVALLLLLGALKDLESDPPPTLH